MDRSLLLRLRQLLDEIDKESSIVEVMWQIRTHTANQAAIPQAIFRVGDRFASVIYLDLLDCWEVQLDRDEHQFETFAKASEFMEQQVLEASGDH